jgi:dTMP kinase
MSKAYAILNNFIVFEGVDGSGTSTQLELLGKRLREAGVSASISAEPTKGPIGRLIRDAIAGRTPLEAESVARLFAADRGEHLNGSGGIRESLKAGGMAVSDRYIFSSLAYQGLTCGPDLPAALNAPFPLPELLLFFDIRPELSLARLSGRGERDIYENESFQTRVDQAYRGVIAAYRDRGMRIAIIDASQSVGAVHEAVWQAVEPLVARARRA